MTSQPKQHEEKDERMQEDDKEPSESQPEPEEQIPSESEVNESQPEAVEQPPPATPIPLPPSQRRKRWHYLLGLILGLIPLIVFLVGFGVALGTQGGVFNAIGTSLIGLILYIVELIITIAFLASKNLRFVGYGLLTAFLATPVVAAVGCSVMSNLIHPR
jgi:hypothetical protein